MVLYSQLAIGTKYINKPKLSILCYTMMKKYVCKFLNYQYTFGKGNIQVARVSVKALPPLDFLLSVFRIYIISFIVLYPHLS